MGLAIAAYSKIKEVQFAAGDRPSSLFWDTHFQADINRHFPGRADDVKDGGVYAYEEKHSFQAGSYHAYNWWREKLAKLAGYPAVNRERHPNARHDAGAWAATSGPFWELITFSDCEGVLGADTCKKLLADFDQFAGEVEKDSDFHADYQEWRKAVRLAADGGCICFY